MLPDALGSVRAESNTGGSVQAMRHFAPYGDVFGEQGIFDAPFTFAGEPLDANGLTHLRARYYDSQLGRFFQIDPSRLERNLYEYGLSNPVMNVDPSGLWIDPTGIGDNEGYEYSCLCGWIDWSHVRLIGMSKSLIDALAIARTNSTLVPTEDGDWLVRVQQDWIGFTAFDDYAVVPANSSILNTSDGPTRLALSIFMSVQERYEETQASVPTHVVANRINSWLRGHLKIPVR